MNYTAKSMKTKIKKFLLFKVIMDGVQQVNLYKKIKKRLLLIP